MTDLKEIYNLQPPYTLRVVPIGQPIEIEVLNKSMAMRVNTIPAFSFVNAEEVNFSDLGMSVLSVGKHTGVATILLGDYYSLNHSFYERSNSCFESPQQAINQYFHKGCTNLTFYKDEVIKCSTRHILVEALATIIENGVFIKHLFINDVCFDLENSRTRTGVGYNATPLVTSSGIVRRTVKLDNGRGSGSGSVFAVRSDIVPQHYLQRMVLIDDFLLVDESPISVEPLDSCPACNSPLRLHDGEWHCDSTDCSPFLEGFLNSISRQSGIDITTLRDQYRRGEKFHYSCDSTIEEQAREEIPVDPIRTYYDILGKDGLRGIMERFFGLHNEQLYCTKAEAIDELFFKFLTFGNVDKREYNRPVVYYPPLHDKAKVMILGEFDGISEQTLELKLAEMGIETSSVVQESTLVIAGEIYVDDEFYPYIKEVTNILVLETDGKIHNVFDLLKKI